MEEDSSIRVQNHEQDTVEARGRPLTAVTDAIAEQVEEILSANRHLSLRDIALLMDVNISHESMRKIMHEKLERRHVCSIWVPHELTDWPSQKSCVTSAKFHTWTLATGWLSTTWKGRLKEWLFKRRRKCRIWRHMPTLVIMFFDLDSVPHLLLFQNLSFWKIMFSLKN